MKKHSEMTHGEKSIFEEMISNQISGLNCLYRAMRPKNDIDYRIKKNGEYGYYIKQ